MSSIKYNEEQILHHLKHYLPAQSALKDFVHHNTLHAFQDRKFFKALYEAKSIFGYKTALSIQDFRALYKNEKIDHQILLKVITDSKGKANVDEWQHLLLDAGVDDVYKGRIGQLRGQWKKQFSIDLDLEIQPFLFRFLCSYLDQGISIWRFPVWNKGFLTTIREIERNTYTSFFKTSRAKDLLMKRHLEISDLLHILAGDEALYEQYLFDQQFSHPGWSGIVSAIEDNPKNLLDVRKITLKELIIFELLLEIDTLDDKFGETWIPLGLRMTEQLHPLFKLDKKPLYFELIELWQDAYEWSYYDQVLAGIKKANSDVKGNPKSLQALFCIDDREGSFRRHVEDIDPSAQTFGTPGFFGVEFYYKPKDSKFAMKVCPAPMNPKYLIKEQSKRKKNKKDFHFANYTHSLFFGWLITHTIGFVSAFRLFINIFIPRFGPATTHSFRHMDKASSLTIETSNIDHKENGLQIGFTIDEMVDRVEGLLKSIGLVDDFSPIIYAIGHGASSVNNTHYAGYDCGACSGRPGSVNARVISYMANHPKVREMLKLRGINLPQSTVFVGALHDTTRDEIEFYDENILPEDLKEFHKKSKEIFEKALNRNAKERSRRFELVNKNKDVVSVHNEVKKRSVSLFEPRPEMNHATNALCIVGRRNLTKNVFLDRRAFMNSYDFALDQKGDYLFKILSAAAPVCGGINLEYYFSRVDNDKLGAGTKLPHNVMGLIGVANGIDGDLRPGLPLQMIEVHDPLRLLMIVEQFPEIVINVIKRSNALYQWFENEWIHLVVVHPESHTLYRFKDEVFTEYQPLYHPKVIHDYNKMMMEATDNIPVFLF